MQDNLWDSLQDEASGILPALPAAIHTIMNTWTNQMGYPVVTVIRNYTSETTNISQVIRLY